MTKTFDERLDAIVLEEKTMASIRKDVGARQLGSIGSTVASILTGGISDAFLPLLEINTDIGEAIKVSKQTILLETYLNKVDDMSAGFEQLKAMIGDPYGHHIFNSLLRILDNYPPEESYIGLLGEVLHEFIRRSQFKDLFGSHQLTLRMIERCSPQALYLLSRYEELPSFSKLPSVIWFNPENDRQELSGDWSKEVVQSAEMDDLLIPIVAELIDSRYLVAVPNGNLFIPTLTQTGQTLFSFLT